MESFFDTEGESRFVSHEFPWPSETLGESTVLKATPDRVREDLMVSILRELLTEQKRTNAYLAEFLGDKL